MTLKDFLNREMSQRNLSQHKLAALSGVSQAAIQKILDEKNDATPDLQTLDKLASALGQPLLNLVRLVKPDANDIDSGALIIARRIQMLPDATRKVLEDLALGAALGKHETVK